MNLAELANQTILFQPFYEAGKPIDQVARESGLDPRSVVKLASNENPLGSSPRALAAAQGALGQAHLYPDGSYDDFRQRLSLRHGLRMDQFIIGNGSNEIIELLGHAFLRPGVECVMPQASFIAYKLVTTLFGATPVEVPLVAMRQDLSALAEAVTSRTRLVFLASPANPVGSVNTADEIATLVRRLPPHVILVFDEAYREYLENPPDLRPLIAEGRKVIGLRTFSKIYGLAALRVGYGYSSPDLISLLQRVRQPFNVNAVAIAAAAAALYDEDFVTRCRDANRAGVIQLEQAFRGWKVDFVPAHANFILVRVGDGVRVADALQRRGLIVRPVKPYGLPEWLRISVGTAGQNGRLLTALQEVLAA